MERKGESIDDDDDGMGVKTFVGEASAEDRSGEFIANWFEGVRLGRVVEDVLRFCGL